jgi:vancomycin permeability regulator SanA
MRSKRLLLLAALAALAGVIATNVAVLRGGRPSPSTTSEVDCALVLGAGVRDDGAPSDVLRDRLDEALSLYRSGRVSRILVSGDHRGPSYDEPNTMRRYLEAQGVPSERIFLDHAGFDTYSSVWRAKHVFGAERIIVVTQRFHVARAVFVARSLGMGAEGAVADRHLYRGLVWLEAREVASRTKAFVDVAIARRPHHDGPRIDLRGDGRVTAG